MCLLLGTLNYQINILTYKVNIFICLNKIKSTISYLDKKKYSLVELFQSLNRPYSIYF